MPSRVRAWALQRGLTSVLLAALVAGCTPPLEVEPSSILLIVVDCLRADHVGSYGYERPTTPRLDELAQEGITFEQAFAQSYWTRPSLPTILTGLYPSEHGMLSLDRDEQGKWTGAALDPSVPTVAERLQAEGWATALIGYQRQLSPKFRLADGFDYYHYKLGNASSINSRFMKWVKRVEAPRYFAYLHYLDIHWPYCPPGRTYGTFDPSEGRINFCENWRGLREGMWNGSIVLDPEDVARGMARYDEELLELDHRLGQLFENLRLRGLWDDLLVVVTADHGEEFMERGDMGHKTGPYDTLIHVPLIVKPPASWPGPRGVRFDALVELTSLTPTFLDAAGLTEERPRNSLVPWIAGRPDEAERREFVIAESANRIAIRTERFKLVVGRDGSEVELYDLAEDPGETRNLATRRAAEVARLERLLAGWRGSLRRLDSSEEVLDQETVEGLRDLGYLD